MAFTATSVLLVLLLVILARMFQTKFKAHFPVRSVPWPSSSQEKEGGGSTGSGLADGRAGWGVSGVRAPSWAGLNSSHHPPTMSSCAPGGRLQRGAGGGRGCLR